MYKKTIKYTDYEGVEREEDFYFNLNKAEIVEMELSKQGGLTAYIEQIIKAKSVPELSALFKELVLKAYGEKSADGKRFIKSKELSEEFTQTEAYANYYTELVFDAEEAARFVNGIMPPNFSADIKQAIDKANNAAN